MPRSINWMMSALVATLAIAGTARAVTPDVIAAKSGCMACHSVDKKLMGPSYHDIAAKYKGDAKAPAALAAKVRSGGTGVWGKMKMLPIDAKKISDADLDAVIAWMLKQ
jgi:cytochrome c